MSDTKTPQIAGLSVETKAEDFREVYANFSRVGLSPWDMSILFGTLGDASLGESRMIANTLVRMSPQQFKAFAISLPGILQAWEARFGRINVDPEFLGSHEGLTEALAGVGKAPTPVTEGPAPTASDKMKPDTQSSRTKNRF